MFLSPVKQRNSRGSDPVKSADMSFASIRDASAARWCRVDRTSLIDLQCSANTATLAADIATTYLISAANGAQQ